MASAAFAEFIPQIFGSAAPNLGRSRRTRTRALDTPTTINEAYDGRHPSRRAAERNAERCLPLRRDAAGSRRGIRRRSIDKRRTNERVIVRPGRRDRVARRPPVRPVVLFIHYGARPRSNAARTAITFPPPRVFHRRFCLPTPLPPCALFFLLRCRLPPPLLNVSGDNGLRSLYS